MISCLPLASVLAQFRRLLVLLQCCRFSTIVRFSFHPFTFQWIGLCFIFPLCSFPALFISALFLFFRVLQNSRLIRQSLVTCTCSIRSLESPAHLCEWRPWVLVIHLPIRCTPSLKTNVLGFLEVESAASARDWNEVDVTGWFLEFPVCFQPSQTDCGSLRIAVKLVRFMIPVRLSRRLLGSLPPLHVCFRRQLGWNLVHVLAMELSHPTSKQFTSYLYPIPWTPFL